MAETSTRHMGSATCTWPVHAPGSSTARRYHEALPSSFTESIIDAVTLYDQGFTNVIPAYGVNGVTEDHLVLFNGAVTEVYLCFDSDQAGKDGAAQAAAQLQKKGITVYTVELPDKDITIYFKPPHSRRVRAAAERRNPASVGAVRFAEQAQTNPIPAGRTRLHGGLRHTAVPGEGYPAGDTQLKATIKVSEDVSSSKPFELTTIDLYSSRSRHWFAKLCADLFAEPEALIKEDLAKLLQLVEQWRPEKQEQQHTEISTGDKELALSFLKSYDIFAALLHRLRHPRRHR
ncbi:MAG: toprim domain-containing protein [Desulfofustis sp. PB-SRB1]|nr:toprim domain-containing protein [Desulfofustis sp. PB-SRB1]